MSKLYRGDWSQNLSGNVVTARHFGTNAVSLDNSFENGSSFTQVIQMLNPTSLRYPGGTVTEDYFDPNSKFFEQVFEDRSHATVTHPDGSQIATVRSTMAYAKAHNMSVDFVLPTEHLLKDGPKGTRIIDEVALNKLMVKVDGLLEGRYGDAKISTFEIGNEYFVDGRLTAEEYGMVAERLTARLSQSYDKYERNHPNHHDFHEPDIAIQAGAGWMPADNDTIMDSLSPESRAEIDAVVGHFYPKALQNVNNFKGFYENLHAWESADGFKDIDIWVSEWNVRNSPASDHGLYQASTFVSAFHEMNEQGVDIATVWGTQHRNVDSSLSNSRFVTSEDDGVQTKIYDLTATGYLFQQMRENLPGLQALDIDSENFIHAKSNDSIDVESFGNSERSVIYISSRSDEFQTIDFDGQEYFNGSTHISAMRITAIDDPRTTEIDESDPHSVSARIDVKGVSRADLMANNGQITLAPGEIIQLEVDYNHGVTLKGYQPNDPIPGHHYNDNFVGSNYADRILGQIGDDRLIGLGGKDIIFGGEGDDTLDGGNGNDFLQGSGGNDRVFGGAGDDFVRGGSGSDVIAGGDGDDRIDAGLGADTLSGGNGDDTLVSLSGSNVASGGKDADLFLSSVDADTTITDFNYEDGDRLSFMGHYEDPAKLLAQVTFADSANGGDRDVVITHETGHVTKIINGEGQYEHLVGGTIDFNDETRAAVELADTLNSLDPTQIDALMRDFNSDDFSTQIMGVDPGTLLVNLEGPQAAAFINGMLPDEADDFFDHVPDESLSHFISGFRADELLSFLNELDGENLDSFLSTLPDTELAYVNSIIEIDDTPTHHPEPTDVGHTPDIHPVDGILRIPVDESDELTDDEEDADEFVASSTCFVASAAYRDRLHPDVVALRVYREEILRKSAAGRGFIRFYWWIGPKLARPVYLHPKVGRLCKIPLQLLVKYIRWRHANIYF